MKNIFKFFSLSIFFAGLLNSGYAQRSREFRGGGNSRLSGSISRAPSTPRQMETRSAPVRSFNTVRTSSPRVQNTQPTRQITATRTPERNFNQSRVTETRNFQNPSSNERVFSQRNNQTSSTQRVIASRNNNERLNSFDRNRAISRNIGLFKKRLFK